MTIDTSFFDKLFWMCKLWRNTKLKWVIEKLCLFEVGSEKIATWWTQKKCHKTKNPKPNLTRGGEGGG